MIARGELHLVSEAVAKLGAKYPAVFWKRYGEGRTETEILMAMDSTILRSTSSPWIPRMPTPIGTA